MKKDTQEVKANKINFKEFINYSENKSFLIILTFIIVLLSHFYILINSNVGLDTDIIMEEPRSSYNWLKLGRVGLIFEKHLLHLGFFSMYFSEIIAIFFLFAFCLVTYYLIYKATGKDIQYLNLIIPLIGLTSPIWAEQFIFTLQIAEISFSLLLTSLSMIFAVKWIFENSKISFFIEICLLTLVFSVYQSFIAVGLIFILFLGIIIFENKNESEVLKEKFYTIIFKLALSFIIPIIGYSIIVRLSINDSTYFSDANTWFKTNDFKTPFYLVCSHCLKIIKGDGIYYNCGLIIGMIITLIVGLIKTIKNENIGKTINKIIYYCMFLALLTTPFLLTVYAGKAQYVRSEFYIPIIEMLLILYITMYIYEIKNMPLICMIFILSIAFEQLYYLESLYYTDNLSRERDKEFVFQIAHDLKENGVQEGTKLYFYGHYKTVSTNAAIRGDFLGTSAFEYCYGTEPLYNYTTTSIVRLLKIYGFNYDKVEDEDEIFSARCIGAQETMPSWPQEGSIVRDNNFVLVKLDQN